MSNFRICFRRRSFHVLDANWRNFARPQPAANATKHAELLAMYAHGAATSRFTGLTGSREQIDRAKNAFRVFAQRVDDPAGNGGYAVVHPAITSDLLT